MIHHDMSSLFYFSLFSSIYFLIQYRISTDGFCILSAATRWNSSRISRVSLTWIATSFLLISFPPFKIFAYEPSARPSRSRPRLKHRPHLRYRPVNDVRLACEKFSLSISFEEAFFSEWRRNYSFETLDVISGYAIKFE